MKPPVVARGWALWRPQRLSSRIVAVFLGLLLVVQLTSLGLVQWNISSNVRHQVTQDLEIGERIWSRLLVQRAARLTLGASVLAADYGFRAAAASGDTDTLRSALDNHGLRIGATVTAMLSSDLTPRALGETADASTLDALRPLAPKLAGQGSALALMGGKPFQLVMVPMKAPQLVGYIVMGFPLDQAVLDDMEAVSGLQVALLLRSPGEAEHVALSTLPGIDVSVLLQAPLSTQVSLPGNKPHIVRSIRQLGAAGAGASSSAGMRTVLLRSLDEAVAPYRPLKATLAALTLLGLVIAGGASAFLARQMTVPLRSLAKATEQMGNGDYSRPLTQGDTPDEIGDLSRAFERMRVSISSHETAIRKLAYWDRLTGLPNRAQFRDCGRYFSGATRWLSASRHCRWGRCDGTVHQSDRLDYRCLFGHRSGAGAGHGARRGAADPVGPQRSGTCCSRCRLSRQHGHRL